MQVVQKMSKSASVETFKDLADVFRQDVEKLMGLFCVVVIMFDTYYDTSLKNSTRSVHLGYAVPVGFTVDDAFDISDTCLKEVSSDTRVKQQLTSFFAKKLQTYLEQKISTLLLLEMEC